ncbi:MAG: mandelate racemase/muconate lactonizing enzyme family protein [Dehalococcoidia bacterium]|nr:mandelate racemase/muconate lactonizing enzyme family protein [Dehalococcoidia bacterium]
MKITRVKAYVLEQPLGDTSFAFSQGWINTRQTTIVIVSTDQGIEGVGESFGPAKTIGKAVESYCAPMILGKDPFNSSVLWDTIYGFLRMNSQKGILIEALSAIDIALWDIKGKALGLPVYKLLGGAYRDKAHAYATGLYRPNVKNAKEALVQEAMGYKQEGFFAMKYKIGTVSPEEDLDILKAIRKAIRDDVKLMVDANCAYDATEAIRLARQMEPYNIYWFEEPVPPEDIEGSIEVKNSTTIRIAGGECECTRYGFRELITRHAVDILQPDVCIAGGFTEMQKIVTMASAWNMQCIPHIWGTNVAIAAALHCYAAIPNIPGKINPPEPFFEYDRSPNPLRGEATYEKFTLKDSYIDIPQKPGLGVTVNMDFLNAKAL